jgi:hypothetical protein
MSDAPARRQDDSATAKFIREASIVRDPDNKLWAPAKWVVGMFQYLIAIVLVSESIKQVIRNSGVV